MICIWLSNNHLKTYRSSTHAPALRQLDLKSKVFPSENTKSYGTLVRIKVRKTLPRMRHKLSGGLSFQSWYEPEYLSKTKPVRSTTVLLCNVGCYNRWYHFLIRISDTFVFFRRLRRLKKCRKTLFFDQSAKGVPFRTWSESSSEIFIYFLFYFIF